MHECPTRRDEDAIDRRSDFLSTTGQIDALRRPFSFSVLDVKPSGLCGARRRRQMTLQETIFGSVRCEPSSSRTRVRRSSAALTRRPASLVVRRLAVVVPSRSRRTIMQGPEPRSASSQEPPSSRRGSVRVRIPGSEHGTGWTLHLRPASPPRRSAKVRPLI